MYADPKNPGLRKFREAREKGKELAILRKEIRENNENLTESQVNEIAKASYRAKHTPQRTVQVQKRGKKNRKGRKNKAITVKVEVVNKK